MVFQFFGCSPATRLFSAVDHDDIPSWRTVRILVYVCLQADMCGLDISSPTIRRPQWCLLQTEAVYGCARSNEVGSYTFGRQAVADRNFDYQPQSPSVASVTSVRCFPLSSSSRTEAASSTEELSPFSPVGRQAGASRDNGLIRGKIPFTIRGKERL
jgi:hypothetical protein